MITVLRIAYIFIILSGFYNIYDEWQDPTTSWLRSFLVGVFCTTIAISLIVLIILAGMALL